MITMIIAFTVIIHNGDDNKHVQFTYNFLYLFLSFNYFSQPCCLFLVPAPFPFVLYHRQFSSSVNHESFPCVPFLTAPRLPFPSLKFTPPTGKHFTASCSARRPFSNTLVSHKGDKFLHARRESEGLGEGIRGMGRGGGLLVGGRGREGARYRERVRCDAETIHNKVKWCRLWQSRVDEHRDKLFI